MRSADESRWSSREKYMGDWDGETEYVQHTLLKYVDADRADTDSLPPDAAEFVGSDPEAEIDARIDPENAEVYVCGIGAMCNSVRNVVEPLGVPEHYHEEESYGRGSGSQRSDHWWQRWRAGAREARDSREGRPNERSE